MNVFRPLFAVTLLTGLAGCSADSKSGRGFTLPEGDANRGQSVFTQLRCYDCHSVSGLDLPAGEDPDQTVVRLGGEVSRIKTYGELVTSIINPSHRLARGYAADNGLTDEGESPMRNYNDVMTVNQLIDLVAFLQSHYVLWEYQPTTYGPYHYGL